MALSTKASRAWSRIRGQKGHKVPAKDEKKKVKERRGILKKDPVETQGAQPASRKSHRLTRKAGATSIATNKRKADMGQNAVHVHEDHNVQHRQPPQKLRRMSSQRHIVLLSDDRDESQEVDEEETTSEGSEESESDVDETVAEDMRKLEESFKGISQKYRLINRIGEGTFSTVYKAEQLLRHDDEEIENEDPHETTNPDIPLTKKRRTVTSSQTTQTSRSRKGRLVALKKIYVTSSPHRIANELELLHILRDSPYICPLLTAFRHLDQVIAVLPYFSHTDFRLYYRDFMAIDIRFYFHNLLSALHSVHKAGILHRDIKPTNFLYDAEKRKGVLVDFGLAEKQGTDWQPCLCSEHSRTRHDRYMNSFAIDVLRAQPNHVSTSYPNPKSDPRSSRRANRAGTRGFRAPEVLLKCTSQTTKIDIWSAGVILLTILAQRFPFFNSADDVDAMIEMASIFGKKKMKVVSALHGSVFETNIETVGEAGFTLERIVLWASCREKGPAETALRAGEQQAVNFLEGLLELDPNKRWTAKEALQHEFFTAAVEDEDERAEREEREAAEEAERKKRVGASR